MIKKIIKGIVLIGLVIIVYVHHQTVYFLWMIKEGIDESYEGEMTYKHMVIDHRFHKNYHEVDLNVRSGLLFDTDIKLLKSEIVLGQPLLIAIPDLFDDYVAFEQDQVKTTWQFSDYVSWYFYIHKHLIYDETFQLILEKDQLEQLFDSKPTFFLWDDFEYGVFYLDASQTSFTVKAVIEDELLTGEYHITEDVIPKTREIIEGDQVLDEWIEIIDEIKAWYER